MLTADPMSLLSPEERSSIQRGAAHLPVVLTQSSPVSYDELQDPLFRELEDLTRSWGKYVKSTTLGWERASPNYILGFVMQDLGVGSSSGFRLSTLLELRSRYEEEMGALILDEELHSRHSLFQWQCDQLEEKVRAWPLLCALLQDYAVALYDAAILAPDSRVHRHLFAPLFRERNICFSELTTGHVQHFLGVADALQETPPYRAMLAEGEHPPEKVAAYLGNLASLRECIERELVTLDIEETLA